MNICPYCEHNNREGVLICEHCGRSRSIFSNLPTRVIPEDTHDASPRWQGSDHFSEDTFVVMYVEEEREPIILPVTERTVLGRANATIERYPDVDLTHYDAFVQGVSSHHVVLERQSDQLLVADLGSTNGTYLNGERLTPHQPVPARDGAELKLGKLTLHLYFESSACAPIHQDSPDYAHH